MSLNKESNERLWDAVIKEALIENVNQELHELEQNTEYHEFSPRFEKEMKMLCSKINRSEKIKSARRILSKCAVTVSAVMGVIFGGLLTQPEVYAAVGNVVKSIFDTHDKYTYQDDIEEGCFDETKKLGYIPNGYELRSVFYMGNSMLLTYESENEEYLYFKYSYADGSSITVDNEEHDYKEINKNRQIYYYYNSVSEGFNTIIWYSGDYVYSIDSQLPEEELVNIAENVDK